MRERKGKKDAFDIQLLFCWKRRTGFQPLRRHAGLWRRLSFSLLNRRFRKLFQQIYLVGKASGPETVVDIHNGNSGHT